ncbi:phenylalanine--tRNA ligase subunit beta [Aureibaculum sp. 2210JD6-5]|uniref:phenylalanine--tRNA ligase subunit beta n=1 Tax=Aureibaculum sp. 2210JD6-5 TaxID=3103957 RepID=UPI002AAF01EB|nr:phenylalanine--tRNA ligase subunit beta [Aureibaculum sp. 2210JD6-5]MDY7395140.1 phenylalanine--tRNA ligase subunit beta [Aureibaculum sp. 2210JD6-5]
MKISYSWLQQFLKIDLDAEKVGELLTDLGLEVEGIEKVESVKGSLEGIIVGKVLTCEKHPNADRLKITTVDLGNGEPLQIVCGAPNVAAGQKVPVATVGTTLYDNEGNGFKIKKGNIRGEASHGMICAEDELGLGDSHDGILVLDKKTKIGIPAAELFEISTDYVFEIGLTPNRSDAMSHFGVARDLRAGLLHQNINKELITPSVSRFDVDIRSLKIQVEVANKKQVPRYAGVTISGIKVEDSPKWMQDKLKAIGVNPINNIVDITNYVLHELGQPLHAFDAAKIKGNKIKVKNLPKDTEFVTLDGETQKLHKDDIMICDGDSNPLCIGGVYGGLDSGVTENTTAIFLESAYFDQVSIRKTAKRFGLNTDASFRFERGIDPNITDYALKRAALLIEEIAGGKISSDLVDIYPNKIEDHQVRFSFDKAEKLIGEELKPDTIKNILASLDIKINNQTDSGLGLTIPAYRTDVTREADIIEEILRVYGYNNIKTSPKLNTSISYVPKPDANKLQNLIADQLASQGFYEMMANSLTSPDYEDYSDQINSKQNVKMLNPLSTDLSVMRQTLLFSGLEAVAYNINRKNSDLKLFEFGNTYHKFDGKYEEQKHISILISGNRNDNNWLVETKKSDFFFGKGIVQSVLERVGINSYKSGPIENALFSEGISLQVGKKTLVDFGVVKSNITKQFGIKQEVLYADFNWDAMLQFIKNKTLKVTDLTKFPSVKRDFSLLLDKQITFNEIYHLAFQTDKQLLKSVDLFDVYEGDKLPENKKSYAVSFMLQDDKQTLTDKQIDGVMKKLQQTFENKLKAELRA